MAELQRGIYWDKGATPPRCYGIAFLKAAPNTSAAEIDATLTTLVDLWEKLRFGVTPTLRGATVPASSLEWLLGFGRKAFDILETNRKSPRSLRSPNTFNSIDPLGGGLVADGSGLRYAPGVAQNLATEEFCVQFTGDTPLSVSRAVVETSYLLESQRNPQTGRAPLLMSASFTGFNREDHRSWIDFHDGLSNLRSGDERRSAITIRPQGLTKGDKWTTGGTYMAFIRVRVAINVWRQLTDGTQETVVGRTKLTGCPAIAVGNTGAVIAIPGCPAPGTSEVGTESGNIQFLEPPDAVDATMRLSHVQRSNHHIVKQRVFRQGYEFFESSAPGRPIEVGLNFVSFQDTPDRLFFILKQPGWLGHTNFGGNPGPELLHVVAAAIFICPPIVKGEAYPGASTFNPLVS